MLNFNPFEGPEHAPFYLPGTNQGAVLLVHGFPGTPAEMLPLGKLFNEAGWTAQGVLLPGFGAQFANLRQYKAADWIAEVRRALAELQKTYAVTLLAGFSMGGGLSLQVAAQQPPDGLLLLAPFWQTSGWFWATMPIFKHIFPTIKPLRMIKIDLSSDEARDGLARFLPGADLDDPQVRKAIRNFEFPLAVLDELRTVGAGARAAASQVRSPVLAIQGTRDDLVRPAATRQLLDQMTGVKVYKEVDGAHDLPNPDKIAWPVISAELLRFAQAFLDRPGLSNSA